MIQLCVFQSAHDKMSAVTKILLNLKNLRASAELVLFTANSKLKVARIDTYWRQSA